MISNSIMDEVANKSLLLKGSLSSQPRKSKRERESSPQTEILIVRTKTYGSPLLKIPNTKISYVYSKTTNVKRKNGH